VRVTRLTTGAVPYTATTTVTVQRWC
jgi:hypothetical protein